jgi:signal transduction histidine kinase/ActR/RegA family two-component response regulator
MTAGQRYLSKLDRFVRGGTAFVICVAVAVLLGWLLDIAPLKRVFPGLATMKANTAFGLLSAGIALRILHTAESGSRRQLAARVLSVFVAILGAFTLAQDLFTVDFGIDQILLSDDPAPAATSKPGRMSPATALNFFLIGLALLVLKARQPHIAASVQFLRPLPLFISGIAIIGYVYDVASLYQVAAFTSMAVHTAVSFFVLSLCIVAADTRHGFALIATSDTVGGLLARRLIPTLPFILFVLGWLVLAGERMELYESDSAVTLLVVLSTTVCIVAVAWSAISLDKIDTNRQRAEEQLRQSQKMEVIGTLTGGIAHDFNNVLTVITSTIDLLIDGVADRPELARIAGLINQAAARGAKLTGQLLAFARKQPLHTRETDINALLVEAKTLIETTLGGRIDFEWKLDAGLSRAFVDPSQLVTAIVNLAVNARDAMPNGGTLTLETANVVLDEDTSSNNGIEPGSYVMIAVSDTGTGIPVEIREKIFEPFFSTKDIGKGTGLGLSMVYGFVKQSGGHIMVYSEVGYGTTIKLFLPITEQRENLVRSELPAASEGGSEKILLVEDDELVRTSATAQLQALGYDVVTATNATEALAIVRSGTEFDLLFTDIVMPGGIDGRQLAEEVAKLHSPLKVLFTSGYSGFASVRNGKLESGTVLLPKPYSKSDLARLVRDTLGESGTKMQ